MELFRICIFAACVAAIHGMGESACSGLSDTSSKNCGKWALGGFCDKVANKQWMQTNCALSCCDTSKGEFSDDDENCKDWAEEGCGTNDFVDKNCKKACKQLAKQRAVLLDSMLAEEESSESGEIANNNTATNATDTNTCYDKTDTSTFGEESCRSWAWAGSCLVPKYKDYMQSNCAYTCCERTSEGVRDANKGCRGWARSGWCGKSDYMITNCQKSCAQGDRDVSCQTWADEGKCETNKFVQQKCKKACGNMKKRLQEARRKARKAIRSANYGAFQAKRLAVREERDARRKANNDQKKLVKEISKDKQAEIKILRKDANAAKKRQDEILREKKMYMSKKEKRKAEKEAREIKKGLNKKLREDIDKIAVIAKEGKQLAYQVKQETVSNAKAKQQDEKAKANANKATEKNMAKETVKAAKDAKDAKQAVKAAKKEGKQMAKNAYQAAKDAVKGAKDGAKIVCSGLKETVTRCGKWAKQGFCDTEANKEYMQQNCRLSCCMAEVKK